MKQLGDLVTLQELLKAGMKKNLYFSQDIEDYQEEVSQLKLRERETT